MSKDTSESTTSPANTQRSAGRFGVLLDSRRRPFVIAAGVVVLALVVSAIVFFAVQPHSRTESFTVPTSGGAFGSDAIVTVPSGALTSATKLEILSGSDGGPSDATAAAYAEPLGTSYEITFTAVTEIEGATVSVPLDPSELPVVDGRQTTTEGAFLAVYNDQLDTWIPIPTSHEGGRLVAEAPHFSWFRKYVINPIKTAASGAADLANASVDAIPGGRALFSSLAKTFGVTVDEADCSKPDPDWTVASSSSFFPACMVKRDDGDYELRMSNELFLRYIVDPPETYGIGANDSDTGLDAGSAIARLWQIHNHNTVLPSRGQGQVSLPSTEAERIANFGEDTVHLTPDMFGLIMDAGLVALSVWPVAKKSVQVISKTTVRAAVSEIGGITTPALYVERISETITKDVVRNGGTLAGAQAIASVLSCGAAALDALSPQSGEDVLDAAVREGKECALGVLRDNVEGSAKDLLSLFTVFPDGIRAWQGLVTSTAVSEFDRDLLDVSIRVSTTATPTTPPLGSTASPGTTQESPPPPAASTQGVTPATGTSAYQGFIRRLSATSLTVDIFKVAGDVDGNGNHTYRVDSDEDGPVLYTIPISPTAQFGYRTPDGVVSVASLRDLPRSPVTSASDDIDLLSVIYFTDGVVTKVDVGTSLIRMIVEGDL
ncbi:hypothetical protein [Naasia lichenicola]|uniref:Uncharacterized protein n=1 Tax=Naasia lichenicola TaxID=2565933 RepID=A0A4S4FQA8_9MICO|nr:hypothetical protein [Naasia lichenicola]THG30785.1 hypothetical protein E6C64_09100 [Naasia lichenicola]THG32022.1 hypothetical protein E6C64_08245 [Naasia lichenicola]